MRARWICLIALALAGCAGSNRLMPDNALSESAARQLAAEPADSDAAVVLAGAVKESRSASADKRAEILRRGLEQAEEARRFTPRLEAPLPEGWPKPSLPGLIRIKSYPPVRAAWARGPSGDNSRFMALFRHIENRQIAMTAPVVMGYPDADGGPGRSGDSMAFLYRRLDQDAKGRFGSVDVEDQPAVKVVSVGLTGAYREAAFRAAAENLRAWLAAHAEWKADGPVRVLAYNSPFVPFWQKYSEVQIPIRGMTVGRSSRAE